MLALPHVKEVERYLCLLLCSEPLKVLSLNLQEEYSEQNFLNL